VDKLTPKELERYSRHLSLKGFGTEGQLKLKQASVLVVGAGGLGCPALLYLVAAGVGTIGVADFDKVQESNLQRQVLFTVDDLGSNKAEAACNHLKKLNPYVKLTSITKKITSHNIVEIISNYDIMMDATDNFPTRYLLNDACVLTNKPLVYGSVLEFEGQVSVFNVNSENGFSCNYRDLFPVPPPPSAAPNCEQAGVLGVLPGIIGGLQANEIIKLITGTGEPLINKLLIFDSLSLHTTVISLQSKNSRATITGLIDYDQFCSVENSNHKIPEMKEITVQELHAMKHSGEDFQLIDVRESYEYDSCNLGGKHIPLSEIPHNISEISTTKKVVIHCKSGGRSNQAVLWLEKNHKFTNLFSLKGGITAWANEIDPSLNDFL